MVCEKRTRTSTNFGKLGKVACARVITVEVIDHQFILVNGMARSLISSIEILSTPANCTALAQGQSNTAPIKI